MPSAPARAALYGPIVVCREFARSVAFYRDQLGLDLTGGDGSPPWAEFQSGHGPLVLLDRSFWDAVHGPNAPPSGATGGGSIALAIEVDDVDDCCRRCSAAGVVCELEPADRPMMGVRNALVRDPDGNLVEITTKLRGPG